MAHPKILESGRTALIVIDIQEGFRHAIPDFAVVASRASMAVRGFQILGLPVIVTEQYPKGLGQTAEEIRLVLPDEYEPVEKTAFSSSGAASVLSSLEEGSINQVVLCGLETHVCVNQTAHDLIDRGYEVHLLNDAVCSRFDHDKAAGLAKMQMNGVIPSSIEMALFELMRDARHEQFKEVQALIK
jgi:nicotinamidase-related amidase